MRRYLEISRKHLNKLRTKHIIPVAILATFIVAGPTFLAQKSTTPAITNLSPDTGPIGAAITINGIGFTQDNNIIVVRGKDFATLSSSDGTTLTYILTADTGCDIGQACPIKVKNSNGITNAVPLRVIEALPVTPAPTSIPEPIPTLALLEGSLKISSPIGGRGWVRGTSLPVQVEDVRTYSTSYGSVMVNLLQGGAKVKSIFETPPGPPYYAGISMRWTIPTDVAPGSNYTVEALYADRRDIRTVSESFSILGDTMTVHGRVTNSFTGAGIPDVRLNVGPPYAIVGTTSTDGTYTFDHATNQWSLAITHATSDRSKCFIQSASYATSYNISDGSYWLYLYATPEPHSQDKVKPVLGPEITHDIPLWPAADFILKSDVPTRYDLIYAARPEDQASGNPVYRTEHYLSFAIPLDMDVRARVWDEAGNVFTSPVYRASRDRACTPAVTATFQNGQFTWK